MSRPLADMQGVFGGKPIAVIGATPGGFGTILSHIYLQPNAGGLVDLVVPAGHTSLISGVKNNITMNFNLAIE